MTFAKLKLNTYLTFICTLTSIQVMEQSLAEINIDKNVLVLVPGPNPDTGQEIRRAAKRFNCHHRNRQTIAQSTECTLLALTN